MVSRLIHHIISCLFIGPLGLCPLSNLNLIRLYKSQQKKDAPVETGHPLVHL